MATYTNTTRVDNGSLDDALGNPSLLANDTVLIVDDTADDYTADLDLSSVALTLLVMGGAWHGDAGSDSGSVKVDAATVRVSDYRGRKIRLTGKAAATITTLHIKCQSEAQQVILTNLTATTIVIESGTVTFGTGVEATNIRVAGPMARAYITNDGSPSAATLISVTGGGRAWIDRDVATLQVGAGSFAHARETTVTPTTVNNEGGEIVYAGGAYGTWNNTGGVVDFSRLAASLSVGSATYNQYAPARVIAAPAGLTGWRPSDANTFNDFAGSGDYVVSPGR